MTDTTANAVRGTDGPGRATAAAGLPAGAGTRGCSETDAAHRPAPAARTRHAAGSAALTVGAATEAVTAAAPATGHATGAFTAGGVAFRAPVGTERDTAPAAGPETGAEPAPAAPGGPPKLGSFLARAAAVTAGLTAGGALLGLVRDQTIAHLFGASVESDAFLIAWTVPEMASTLLIEDAMALLLVPVFSAALVRRSAAGQAPAEDPVRALVAATLPRLFVLLACAAGLLVVAAPLVVRILAPGFSDPQLAVDCTRLTALTVLTFGITGYFSAALRAHGSFLPPAGVYVAYNLGIIVTTLTLHSMWGVRAAAAGVAVGSLLMILVQLPTFARLVTSLRLKRGQRRRRRRRRSRPPRIGPLGIALLAPVILFAVSRQAQVLVERFLASDLPAGAISHLNYAQKVAQMPMVLSLMICTVTFPVVAQAMADGDRERARLRVERDLALAGLVVLLGTALVIGYAPQIIEVLFQRGAFDAHDTATTAAVMRVYAAGLLGHCLVGALGRPFFSTSRPTWFPAAAMAAGLVVTTAAGAAAVGHWGVYGIAAANAVGISTTAVLLLCGLGSRVVPVQVRAISLSLGRLCVAAAAAGAAGLLAGPRVADPLLSLALGCLLVPAVFVVTALAARAPEVVHPLALTRQRFRHGR